MENEKVIEKQCRELAKEKNVKIRKYDTGNIVLTYMDGVFNGKKIFNNWGMVSRFLNNFK